MMCGNMYTSAYDKIIHITPIIQFDK